MKIAIIGGGITGLTTGFYLAKKNHQITIFEKNSFLGGLASGFKTGNWYLERFYHHIFKSDQAIIKLTKELGLTDFWLWQDCGAPIFYEGKIYHFGSVSDLLKFKPLSFINRLRTGLISLFLMTNNNYHSLEKFTAERWLRKWMGKKSWQVIWKPLLEKKFGDYHKQISMSWVWARIHKRSRYLGYPKGGFQVIFNKLAIKIKKREGKIILNKEIKSINQLKSFDKVIFTGASPLFLKIAPQLPLWYCQQLERIKYLGSVVLLLALKKSLTKAYWLNINDPKTPFVGCIQHSNLVNKKFYNNFHYIYLVAYVEKNSLLFKKPAKDIYYQWMKHLKKINKNFNPSWLKKYYVFKESYTQPLFRINDYKYIPEFITPLKNVYLVNMFQIYPWDRGINYAVDLGKRVAILITKQSN